MVIYKSCLRETISSEKAINKLSDFVIRMMADKTIEDIKKDYFSSSEENQKILYDLTYFFHPRLSINISGLIEFMTYLKNSSFNIIFKGKL